MRFMIPFALLASLAILGCASMENRMVYYPRGFDETIDKTSSPAQDINVTTATGGTIHARWFPNPGSKGALIYCPGNAGNMQTRAHRIQNLWVGLGEGVLIFDYPGYGKSAGTPSEAGCYEAAEAAYQWLIREQKMSPDRVIIFGESLGGAVAVDLATKQQHAALVLDRTFTSVPDVADHQMPLFPGYWVMSNRFDSLQKISKCRQPIFIAQAEKDKLIPVSQGEKLRRACQGPAELFVMKGIGHNDDLPTDFYPALRNFLAVNRSVGLSNGKQ